MSQTDAKAETMQSFGLASSTPDNTSASSVSAVPHALLKLSGETTGRLRSIALKASSSESVTVSRLGEELGDGGEGTSLDIMAISGVGFVLESGGGVLRPKIRKRAKL
jgi:hypothetical protein